MWWRNNARHTRKKEPCSNGLSESDQFTVLRNGILHVHLPGPIISYDRLKLVVDWLATWTRGEIREVIFDFDAVEVIKEPWTLVWALLIYFARQTNLICRVRSLHEQPAATIQLFHRNRDLLQLISTGSLSVGRREQPVYRRAG